MSTDPGPIAFRGVRLLLRAIQLLCAAIILSIFSYFLAALSNHALPTPNWVRAVEGIAGIAVGYTGLHIATLILFPKAAVPRPFTSLVNMVLDGSFAVAFIYVAAANRGGSGTCTGIVSTPFGEGDADTGKKVESGAQGGFTTLPSLRQACQLETACLAVAVIALYASPPFLSFCFPVGWCCVIFYLSRLLNIQLLTNGSKVLLHFLHPGRSGHGPQPAQGTATGAATERVRGRRRVQRADRATATGTATPARVLVCIVWPPEKRCDWRSWASSESQRTPRARDTQRLSR